MIIPTNDEPTTMPTTIYLPYTDPPDWLGYADLAAMDLAEGEIRAVVQGHSAVHVDELDDRLGLLWMLDGRNTAEVLP